MFVTLFSFLYLSVEIKSLSFIVLKCFKKKIFKKFGSEYFFIIKGIISTTIFIMKGVSNIYCSFILSIISSYCLTLHSLESLIYKSLCCSLLISIIIGYCLSIFIISTIESSLRRKSPSNSRSLFN